MSIVNVINVLCKNPIDKFSSQFKFEIVFECLEELKNDIEWKLIYIGKADDPSYDQELDSILIGPLQVGQMKFDFEADAPDWKKIPKEDLLGVTAIILTCSYSNQEFFRVGFYINNIHEDENYEIDTSPIDISKINRLILSDKPRITKFNISWDNNTQSIPTYSNHGMFETGNEADNLKNEFDEMKKK